MQLTDMKVNMSGILSLTGPSHMIGTDYDMSRAYAA